MTYFTAIFTAIVCLSVTAILGGLINYFWMKQRIERMIEGFKDETKLLEDDYQILKQQHELEINEIRSQISDKSTAKKVTDKELAKLQEKVAQNELNNLNYAKLQKTFEKSQFEIAELMTKINELNQQIKTQKKKFNEEKRGFELQINDLLAEKELMTFQEVENNANHKESEGILVQTLSSQEQSIEIIREIAKTFDYSTIGQTDESQKDDLKQIIGIGPFTEQKLNALGIYTFQQISNFTPNDVVRVTEIIEFFPGRIERDQWINQAKEFLTVNQTK